MKKLRYALEAILVYILFGLFALLPYKMASNTGGAIGRFLGKKMAARRKAIRNILIAFPDIDEKEAEKMAVDMWDNLGRIMAEYPHLSKLESKGHITVKNKEILDAANASGRPILFITAHLGNWEALPFYLNRHIDTPMALVYRAPNNPWVSNLLKKLRGEGTEQQLAKGKKGAKEIVKIIKEGKNIGMLVDQKMNEGIPVPFFGKHAMTVTSVAQLALKYDCLVLPVYCQRNDDNTSFTIIVEEEFKPINTGQLSKDIEATMRLVNEKMEQWIKQKPAQWLWIHRRWPKKNDPYKSSTDQK